jgi:glycosyltransferase involved in cell wall biosynthesis
MFSVVIPLFNKEQYISRAISSVLNQTRQPQEIIVVDDGSTDGSASLVNENFRNFVKLIRKKNEGVSVARNIGVKMALGEYIAFLDGDDYWHPLYLESLAVAIDAYPQNAIIATAFGMDPNDLGRRNGSWAEILNPFRIISRRAIMRTSSVILKRSFFESETGFNPTLSRGEDTDVFYRAICASGSLVYCPDPLVYYERGDATSLTNADFPIDRFYVSIINRPEYITSFSFKNEEIKKYFLEFIAVFVRINLFRHFDNPANHIELHRIIKNLQPKLWLIDWIFLFVPYWLLGTIVRWGFAKKILLKYINFFLKRIYGLK